MTFPNFETCFKESPGIAIGELVYRQVRSYVTKALCTNSNTNDQDANGVRQKKLSEAFIRFIIGADHAVQTILR